MPLVGQPCTMALIRVLLDKLFGKSATPPRENERSAPDPLNESHGYYGLPGTMQYGAGPAGRVDKTNWKPCESCDRSIPVVADYLISDDGKLLETGTWTYVCPLCGHVHVGTPVWEPDRKSQETCHECGTNLGPALSVSQLQLSERLDASKLPALRESTTGLCPSLGRSLRHVPPRMCAV